MAAGAAAALAFLNQESRARTGAIGGLRVPAPVTMDSFFFGTEDGSGRGWYGAGETLGWGTRPGGVGVGRGFLALPNPSRPVRPERDARPGVKEDVLGG